MQKNRMCFSSEKSVSIYIGTDYGKNRCKDAVSVQ